ncbi:glycogen debranching protein GlgX [Kocuria sp. LUK]|uniref:glycogen debranching protein GlgX n=1 Tax=Kocuria sp. LUK TaxID=2897828 RepID=UPI001E6321D6|nr:glycogen debranching protein GlgX [Kocuria sp. LUK]MCD1145862.1 glycogen debranching protein GlgX [Kocuria sp. LUK]
MPAPEPRDAGAGRDASRPHPLGVHPSAARDGSANVAVYAPGVQDLDLVYRLPGGPWQRRRLPGRTGAVHHGTVPPPEPQRLSATGWGWLRHRDESPALPAGTEYGFVPADSPVAAGPRAPEPADRQVLLDPYGTGLTRLAPPPGVEDPGPDAYGGRYVSVITHQDFDWDGDRPPERPWRDTVVYEAHVKGLTARHPGIPPELRGTYAGLAHPVMVEHLTSLGITAVELLPVHAHLDEPHLTALGLSNYWGYNTLGFFAPHAGYATGAARARGPQGVLEEFKAMVRDLHRAGLEVYLDVVYNHTAEAGQDEPAYCWRGLGDTAYYRHGDDGRYVDVTGCGNSVNFGNPRVVQMALDSLRYWVQQCHVDGFRFDLAPELARDERHRFTRNHPFLVAVGADPALHGVKLIAEPWDVGMGGWQTGHFPEGWADWNDRFRDTVRDFWLTGPRSMSVGGDGGNAARLAGALAGSAEMFAASGRTALASLNFVTAHDGFTLADLVAYDNKHNQANLERNRDGTNDNHSWNHGAEGPARDARIRADRAQTARNLMATLLFSQGVPMITAGDEIGRTQGGNNNAYCQDNEISWVDWRLTPAARAMLTATKALITVRREFLAGQPAHFPTRPDEVLMHWFGPDGAPMTAADWQRPGARTIQVLIGSRGGRITGLMVVNGASADMSVTFPSLTGLVAPDADGETREQVGGVFSLVHSTASVLYGRYGTRFASGRAQGVPASSVSLFRLL